MQSVNLNSVRNIACLNGNNQSSEIMEGVLSYSGRPPWYDSRGNMKEAYVIGISGGSASGKTTVAKSLIDRINVPWVVIQSLDSFYKVLTPDEHERALKMDYDFDDPFAIDHNLAVETIKCMKQGKRVEVPIYDFATYSRAENKYTVVYGANVIILEGLMTFHYKELYDLCDLKIFVDTDSDLRLCRRIKRDMVERGRSLEFILLQCSKFVKPSFERYVAPQLSKADVVFPWNEYNYSAVDMIVQLIKRNLETSGFFFRSKLLQNFNCADKNNYSNFHLIKQDKAVVALKESLRDVFTNRENFCLASRRLMRLCLLKAISLIHKPNQNLDDGCTNIPIDTKICAVSIMHAGEAFEDALKDVLFDYSYGKILIQTNAVTREPEFYHLKLPEQIKNCTVLLLDATIATGATALMAIRILIDHEVSEENIIFSTLILTPVRINAIINAYPKVRIVSAVVDRVVDSNYYIIPGIGNFRERYFGF